MPDPVVVLGRFPPPIDGQSLATARSAELMEADRPVVCINTEPPGPLLHHPDPTFSVGRVVHFVQTARRVRAALAEVPRAPVVWHAVSPSTLGHFRDVLTTLPSLHGRHRVYAVLHRGTFHELFGSALTRPTAVLLARHVSAFVVQSQTLADRLGRWVPAGPSRRDPEHGRPRARPAGRPRAGPDRRGAGAPAAGAVPEQHDRGEGLPRRARGGGPSPRTRRRLPARHGRQLVVGRRPRGLPGTRGCRRAGGRGPPPRWRHRPWAGPAAPPRRRRLRAPDDAPERDPAHRAHRSPGGGLRRGDHRPRRAPGSAGAARPPVRFVPGHDPHAIADAVARLAEPARWTAAAAAARAQFERAFAPAVVGRQWLALVE